MATSIFNVDPNERLYVNWTAYEIQQGGRPLDMERFAKLSAHRIEDMLFDCRWRNVVKCTAANFTQTITDWGICYTFNNDPIRALQVEQPGSVNGLSLRFNIEQYEYTYGENAGAGLKVLLHPQGQHPLVKELGFSVPPGFETSVSVRYNSIANLPNPYRSNCTMRSLLYSKQYTVPLCRYECKIAYVKKMCGCKDIRYQGDDVRVCFPQEQIGCIYSAEANFTANDIECDCPVPCSSYIYEGRVSMAHWPAIHIAPQMERTLNVSQNMSGEFARNNLLDLKIYFDEMSYQELEQRPDYDAGSLQSDVGGYMGLLCGMSIITVGEFIDFIAILIFKKCQRLKHRASVL
ncbi:acid-sensing ion channel 1-like [Amphiura filiformis]|uniref:acid-sensing ion channel 1-like n=1 Tax=Amphiura filiformis TaxID=82378 RepID=UPI003B21D818